MCRGYRAVALEKLALRQQLAALTHQAPTLRRSDRLFWILLAKSWREWRSALIIVQPDTVVRWRREWRRHWTARSRHSRPGRPTTDAAIQTLVNNMGTANPLWGAPRIHGELRDWASRSRSEQFRGSCVGGGGRRHRPGARSSRITWRHSYRWRSVRKRARAVFVDLCLANITSGHKSLTSASPPGTLRAMRDIFRTDVPRSDQPWRRVESSCSRLLPCATNSASSLVRIGAFAQLTVCCGCFCDGCGPGGGKRWSWSSQPLSIVGIAKDSVDAGALARGLEDLVSIHHVEI
jgi:hypothetical protein